jgi:PncC family amidohydrolase
VKVNDISKKFGQILVEKNMKVSICESCTGGMLGNIITQIPGSSRYFKGGVIAYANEIKQNIMNVKADTISKYGVVSADVAREMVQGVCKLFNTRIGISLTGVAGPDGGSVEKPVGLVYIGIVVNNQSAIREYRFHGDRKEIRMQACAQALLLAIEVAEKT